jgi:hypothetical protein
MKHPPTDVTRCDCMEIKRAYEKGRPSAHRAAKAASAGSCGISASPSGPDRSPHSKLGAELAGPVIR